MKNTIYKKLITAVLLFFALQIFSGCNKIGEPVEFQLWSGNANLPPQYQRVQIIRGKINLNSIDIDFNDRKGESRVERKLELTGEDYRNCVEMVRNTDLEKKKARSGGSSFDVTLIDRTGKDEMGVPSNAGKWTEFARKIEQMAAAE